MRYDGDGSDLLVMIADGMGGLIDSRRCPLGEVAEALALHATPRRTPWKRPCSPSNGLATWPPVLG